MAGSLSASPLAQAGEHLPVAGEFLLWPIERMSSGANQRALRRPSAVLA
jgi:hypothetical protein